MGRDLVLDEMMKKHNELWNTREWVIAALLSSFPAGTRFHTRLNKTSLYSNGLDRQVMRILGACEIPTVHKVFHFYWDKYGLTVNDKWCDELHLLLSAYMNYGSCIGLENLGMDFDYQTTEKTLKVAEKAKKHLPPEDYEALRELGQKKLNVGP